MTAPLENASLFLQYYNRIFQNLTSPDILVKLTNNFAMLTFKFAQKKLLAYKSI